MGSGGVAIAALPTVICLKVPFSDGLGGGNTLLPLQGVGYPLYSFTQGVASLCPVLW